jgi:hypothetical protein
LQTEIFYLLSLAVVIWSSELLDSRRLLTSSFMSNPETDGGVTDVVLEKSIGRVIKFE